ncbi:MAG TPA: hypothetical protein V6C65_30980, partial [Allocoleopsis sp.]
MLAKHLLAKRLLPQPPSPRKHPLRSIALVVGGLLLLHLVTFLLAERFWFEAVDYLPVFTTRLMVQGGGAVAVLILSLSVLLH